MSEPPSIPEKGTRKYLVGVVRQLRQLAEFNERELDLPIHLALAATAADVIESMLPKEQKGRCFCDELNLDTDDYFLRPWIFFPEKFVWMPLQGASCLNLPTHVVVYLRADGGGNNII